MGREPPIDPHMTEKETEIIGKHLTHLDTQKAIDHFQTVRMKEDKKRKKAEVMHKVSNKD